MHLFVLQMHSQLVCMVSSMIYSWRWNRKSSTNRYFWKASRSSGARLLWTQRPSILDSEFWFGLDLKLFRPKPEIRKHWPSWILSFKIWPRLTSSIITTKWWLMARPLNMQRETFTILCSTKIWINKIEIDLYHFFFFPKRVAGNLNTTIPSFFIRNVNLSDLRTARKQ